MKTKKNVFQLIIINIYLRLYRLRIKTNQYDKLVANAAPATPNFKLKINK